MAAAVRSVPPGGTTWVRRGGGAALDPAANQFLVVLKPEITSRGDGDRAAVFATVLERLAAGGVATGRARVLSGPYVAARDVVGGLYRELATVSRQGLRACSERVRGRGRRAFGDRWTTTTVVGAEEALAEDAALTADELAAASDPAVTAKLGAGVYAVAVASGEWERVVLNAFHPSQRRWLEVADGCLVAVECASSRPWPGLRDDVVGWYDPRHAAPGSVRAVLRDRAAELGLPPIEVATNAVHVSPGPLEAVYQLAACFGDEGAGWSPVLASALGRRLLDGGFTPAELRLLAANPVVPAVSSDTKVFEATENRDGTAVADLLVAARRLAGGRPGWIPAPGGGDRAPAARSVPR